MGSATLLRRNNLATQQLSPAKRLETRLIIKRLTIALRKNTSDWKASARNKSGKYQIPT